MAKSQIPSNSYLYYQMFQKDIYSIEMQQYFESCLKFYFDL